jgi:transposase
MPFVTGYISSAEVVAGRVQVKMDTSRSQFDEELTNSKGYMMDMISCFDKHKQYQEIVKTVLEAKKDEALIKIEYEVSSNGDFLNFAYQYKTDPSPVTIVTDKADVPVIKLKPPQRTETPQNDPGLSGGAKDRDIHWQVAIKAAIDILRISQTKAMASEDFSGLDDWTYEFLGKAANKIYTLIEDGPRPIVVEAEHEPDPVYDLGDDDDSQIVMEV